MSQDYSDFHLSFVRELASANSSGLEVVLENFLPQKFALSSVDLTPSALRYWAWVAGELLRRGLLTEAERVLEVASETCINMGIDKISRELLFCDLRSQLLRHLSRSCELPEKSRSKFIGELREIAPVEETQLLGIFTFLELSLVYEKTADFERAFNLIERASLLACSCEILPENLQSWIDKKMVALRALMI